MQLNLLVLDGVFDTGLAVLRDAFATANELAQAQGLRVAPLRVDLVGVRPRVQSALGTALDLRPLEAAPVADWLVVSAIGARQPHPLREALNRPDVREACAQLAACKERGTPLAAACIGTFVLAEAGVLDGERATTTWWLAPFFRERYPRVLLDASRMVVRSGRVLTAGAALSHMDLALAIVREASLELAELVARYLVVDTRPSQSTYAVSGHLAQADPLVQAFERWARARLGEGFSLDAAAAALAVSKRTLARRTQQVLGKSPLALFQDLRVEHAVHLLRTTPASVERIAASVGYADPATLAALLRRKLGVAPRALRGEAQQPPLR